MWEDEERFMKEDLSLFLSAGKLKKKIDALDTVKNNNQEVYKEMYDLYTIMQSGIILKGESLQKTINRLLDPDIIEQIAPTAYRNYDVLIQIRNRFAGEYSTRPEDFIVYVSNPDVSSRFNESKTEYMYKRLLEGLNKSIENPNVQLPNYAIEHKKYVNSYRDSRQIVGQKLLSYLRDFNNFKVVNYSLMNDIFTVGRCRSYRYVNKNDVYRTRVHPLHIFPIGLSETSPLVEDSEAVICYHYLTPSEILTRFSEEISNNKKFIDLLTETADKESNRENVYYAGNLDNKYSKDYKIELKHYVWKEVIVKQVLTYADLTTGEEKTKLVDSTYTFEPEKGDIDIKVVYENTLRELWTIPCLKNGISNDFYSEELKTTVLRYGNIAEQRNFLNDTNVCKSPYNGFNLSDNDNFVWSFGKIGLNFQEVINTIMFKFNSAINLSRGKPLFLPHSLVPNSANSDFTAESFFKNFEANGMTFLDSSDSNFAAIVQGIRQVDLTLGDYINFLFSTMQAVKNEWFESVGFNRQRMGDVYASDGKNNTENAVSYSTINTKFLSDAFNHFEITDNLAMLDMARLVFPRGKKINYILNEVDQIFLDLEDEESYNDFCLSEFGIKVGDLVDEANNVKMLKSQVGTLAQNGVKTSTLVTILGSKNLATLNAVLNEIEVREAEMLKQQNEAEAQKANEMLKLQQEDKDKDRATQIEVAKIKAEAQLRSSDINAASFNAAEDKNNNGISDYEDLKNQLEKHNTANSKLELDRQKLALEREKFKASKTTNNHTK